MKKTLLYSIVLFAGLQLNAQGSKVVKANSSYDNLAYVDAIKTYERIAAKGYKSVDLFQKLGDSYYFNANLLEAKKWYTELFNLNEKIEPEYYFRYAQTLKASGDYDKANQYFEKFYQMSSGDIRGQYFKDNKNYREVIKSNSGRYEIKPVSVNSRAYEYGPFKYGNNILFSTSRDSVGVSKNEAKWTGLPFTNLYMAPVNEDGSLGKATKFSTNLNSKFHEDTPIFTKDLQTVYFTRNNYINSKVGKNSKGIVLLKLYKATLKDGKWTDVKELPFNNDEYSVAHPALSPDEKTLYFATNMPGSTGQSDLYKVAVLGEDQYGQPTKVLGGVNTEGRETFPYVNSRNQLFFASDGHQGLGGLDVFMTQLGDNGMPTGPVVNLGEPVNSPMDDFAYIIDTETKKGFFTSNREGGKGLDDIYSFDETKELPYEFNHELEGVVTDTQTGEVIAESTVTLYDENFNEIEKVKSDDKGFYKFNKVKAGKKYYVRSEKEGYETKESSITTPNRPGKSKLPIAKGKRIKEVKEGTDLAKTFDIQIIYFDLDKSDIRTDAALDLEKILDVMKQNPSMKVDVRSHTDSRQTNKYNLDLSNRRAKATIDWLVKNGISKNRLTGRGYGESKLVNNCPDGVECSEEEHQLNRRSEFVIISM